MNLAAEYVLLPVVLAISCRDADWAHRQYHKYQQGINYFMPNDDLEQGREELTHVTLFELTEYDPISSSKMMVIESQTNVAFFRQGQTDLCAPGQPKENRRPRLRNWVVGY